MDAGESEGQVGVATRSRGIGLVQELIIRAVGRGIRSDHEIRQACKQHISGESLNHLLQGLCQDRYLQRSRARYYVGPRGHDYIERRTPPAWEMTTYIPPREPYRRPGSDHTHIPSVAAGQRQEYRRHV